MHAVRLEKNPRAENVKMTAGETSMPSGHSQARRWSGWQAGLEKAKAAPLKACTL
jgi:hypothetical protein